MNLYFSVLGKLVFDFFVIREICIYFRVICKPTTFAGIFFHFFGDFSVIKEPLSASAIFDAIEIIAGYRMVKRILIVSM